MSEQLWATSKATDGERGGQGDLLAMMRGYQMAHNGTVPRISNQLTLFAEAFPVSRTPWLVDGPAPTTSATCGRNLLDSFASLNPDGSWRKTCQGYSQVMLDGSSERFSETWPRAGMTRNGIAYLRVPSAPLTNAIESGSWPTPSASEDKYRLQGSSQQSHSLNGMARGQLNPTWVEWLMGYPRGWTVCAASATRSSRRSRSGSPSGSKRRKG